MFSPENSLPPQIKNIAIIGLGLLGGSLAMAIKQKFPSVTVLGWARRQETITLALNLKVIDIGDTDPKKILPLADLTVICVPLNTTVEFAQKNLSLFKNKSLVIDVGSVKHLIVQILNPLFLQQDIEFLGCHPMAGSHHSGLEFSNAEMYKNALCFITPCANNKKKTVELISNFWQTIGMRPHIIDSQEHDALAARTSHTLHLVAAATVNTYLAHEDATLATGGAFRDFSRIAGSSPDMWTAISEFNRKNIIHAMAELEEEIARVRRMVCDEDWEKLHNYLNHSHERYNLWYQDWIKNNKS